MYVVYDPTRTMASQQRTQRIDHGSVNEQAEEGSVGKKVLSDVSVAQITASALAAVTAMMFSSQIGLAGSVIGVALSAAVTAFSSQIYKNFLVVSKKKAKDQLSSLSSSSQPSPASETRVMPPADAATQDIYSKDHAAFAAYHDKYSHAAAKESDSAVSGSLKVVRKRWFVIAALTLAGMLTVFLTVGVIDTATHGQGIGHKPASIVALSDQKGSTSTVVNEPSSSSSRSTSKASSSSKPKVVQEKKPVAPKSSTSKKTGTVSSSSAKAASSSSSAQTPASSSSGITDSSSSSVADSTSSSTGE